MLGGIWNAQTVPKGYGGAWSALWLVVAIVAFAATSPAPAIPPLARVGVAALAGLLIGCIGVIAAAGTCSGR